MFVMNIKEVRVSSKRTEHIKVGTTVDTFVSYKQSILQH